MLLYNYLYENTILQTNAMQHYWGRKMFEKQEEEWVALIKSFIYGRWKSQPQLSNWVEYVSWYLLMVVWFGFRTFQNSNKKFHDVLTTTYQWVSLLTAQSVSRMWFDPTNGCQMNQIVVQKHLLFSNKVDLTLERSVVFLRQRLRWNKFNQVKL